MGVKYGDGKYYGTRGSITKTYFIVGTKREAKALLGLLPSEIQDNAKRFLKAASHGYNSFSISKDTSGNYIFIREKPGDVPGSRAIYFKYVDSGGKTIKVYKETYDPQGKLVHSKEKPVRSK